MYGWAALTRRVALGVAVAVGLALVLVLPAAWDQKRDRDRVDELSDDPVLSLDVPGLSEPSSITTEPGGGSGPTLRSGEVRRTWRVHASPSDLQERVVREIGRSGWEVTDVREVGGTLRLQGRRQYGGWTALLTGLFLERTEGLEFQLTLNAPPVAEG